MVYSHTQISQYLRCPRSYRYRYLDGWREKDTRAGMVFGRCFENALGAYFRGEDCTAALFREWSRPSRCSFSIPQRANPGIGCCTRAFICSHRFAQDDRIRISDPTENTQIKLNRTLTGGNEFVSYIDAIGDLDGQRCLIDWKTTTQPVQRRPRWLALA